MTATVDLQIASDGDDLPDPSSIERWVSAALSAAMTAGETSYDSAEISVRLVDEPESQDLNHRYRDKDKPTNVLSFPSDLPPEIQQSLEQPLLGDLVVCAPVVRLEAKEQSKSLDAHWAHMLVHGTLHLLGYDHIEDSEADIMESLETQVLTGLDYPAPYEDAAVDACGHG